MITVILVLYSYVRINGAMHKGVCALTFLSLTIYHQPLKTLIYEYISSLL